MIVGKRIKKLRNSQNVSRQDFCQGIVSLSHLSNIENGRYLPSEDILICIANRAGVPKEYLLNPYMKQAELEVKLSELYSIMEVDVDECLRKIESYEKENPCIFSYHLEIEFYLIKAKCLIKLSKMEIAHKVYTDKVESLIDDSLLEDENLRYLLKKFKGIFSYYTRNYDQAITDYKNFLREDLCTVEKAKVNFNIALCYDRKFNYYYAIRHGLMALDSYLQSHDWEGSCASYNLLGTLFKSLQDYNTANFYYNKAKTLSEEMNLTLLRGKVLHNLGEMDKYRGYYDKAIQFFYKCLELKNTSRNTNISITYCSLVYCLLKLHMFDDANKYLLTALEQSNSEYYEIQLNVYKEKIIYLKGQESIYEHSLKAAIDYFENINDTSNFTLYVKELGDYYWEQRKYKLAAECFKSIS